MKICIVKHGKLVIYSDVGQTFMCGAKGGEVYRKVKAVQLAVLTGKAGAAKTAATEAKLAKALETDAADPACCCGCKPALAADV